MLIVVTGGSGSGKSAYAESLVLMQGEARRYYIATMYPWDEECKIKIRKHQVMRAQKQFKTIECFQDLDQVEIEPESVVLLECMSNLTSNEYYRMEGGQDEIKKRIINGVRHLQNQTKTLIIVTNEVFSDGIDYDGETKAYIELLGAINRELAFIADQVIEVVYGIAVIRKPVRGRNDETAG